MKSFIGGEDVHYAWSCEEYGNYVWAFSKGAMNVMLSSQSNRQPVKPDLAIPFRDARIVRWPCSFSSWAMELATLPVPPKVGRGWLVSDDVVVNWI